jgi:hypothetical protein
VLRASTESSANASGGSLDGQGDVKALSGTIATNTVLSSALAYILDSSVTTDSGDVALNAVNVSQIDAITKAVTTSGDQGLAITLAFNSIGWAPTNILFNTVDALLGDSIIADALDQAKSAARTEAFIVDSAIRSAGAVLLDAVNEAQLNAEISTESTSLAVALVDANSKAGGVMLATNKVNSGARAYIDQGSDRAASPVLAGGEVRVFAADNAGIDAHTKIEVTASTTNDGGLDIALKLASAYLSEYQFTTESGSQFVREGDLVRVAEGYAGGGLGGALYMYDGADATVNVGAQDYATSPNWVLISASTFYDDVKAVLDVLPNNLTNVTKSDAIAAGGMFVRNDVRSGVEAAIRDAIVTADGSVSVTALESATILALIESTVLSDGGSVVGGGDSIAVNGTVATNLVLSSAVAAIDGSVVTANAGGSVTVLADNTSNIDAIVDSSTISNGTSVGVVLAFNTIGIQPQNWLFSTVDALIGTNIANEQPAATRASITDSTCRPPAPSASPRCPTPPSTPRSAAPRVPSSSTPRAAATTSPAPAASASAPCWR